MEWKVIGLSAVVNAVLTILLSIMVFPLFFVGPFIGGFLAAYLSKGYEDYDIMDEKDGAVVGALSGLIGGLIIALFIIFGFGMIDALIKTFIGNTGSSVLILGYIVIQLSVLMSFVLGLIGGVIGVYIKR